MMATMPPSLQQALKSLCSKTGWCYAVFWKLKRRSRMMLTWEDGYCDYSRSYGDACNNTSRVCIDKGGNPLDQGGSGDLEGQISLAVARMSYYVYSMGEGIIGRVAFTGKYQWAFHDVENHLETASGSNMSNQHASEKNSDSWQSQFAAGIKTIAVISVSQGVVQLGSSKLIKEDSKWIDHVKSVFSALQTAQLAPRPELLLEAQGPGSSCTIRSTVSGNACSLTRKSFEAQHNQFTPRNAGDPVELQKTLGQQLSPAVPACVQGRNSMDGSICASRAVCQELQFQQLEKVLSEPQYVKNSKAVGVSRATQRNLSALQFAVPSSGTTNVVPPKNTKNLSMDDYRLENLNKDLTWSSFVAEDLLAGLHDTSAGVHVPATCGESPVDKVFTHMQEEYSLNKKSAICRMSEGTKEETFSSDCFGAVHQQHHQNLSNSKDATLKSGDLSFGVGGGIANKQYINDIAYIASGDITSQFSVDPFLASSRDFSCGSSFFVTKPEICHIERESKFCNNGGQNDLNTLEELEKFLSSFCKEETANCDNSFAIGDELSQALGPSFWKGGLDELQNVGKDQKSEGLASKQTENLPTLPAEETRHWRSGLSREKTHKNLTIPNPLDDKPERLLDAVVGVAPNNCSLNRDASFNIRASFSNRCGMDAVSVIQETQPIHRSSLCGKRVMQTAPHSELGYSTNLAGSLKNLQSHQNFCLSNDTQATGSVQSWTDDGNSWKSEDTQRAHSQSKRSEELLKSSKKRSRSGENARPRPKDRQQIQDRVRELRDIVPSGSKCSIDALLEKTIKHMVFLHSVTSHAEQLKNIGELKEDPDNDASWAFDLGSQEKQIPIVVKQLNQPRQMLVEMMCDESGSFLETADTIRNLGLQILKGSMDSYGDKYWARFIVEANREIQRVDVLVSLIQRLHLDSNSSSSSMTMASQSTAVKP